MSTSSSSSSRRGGPFEGPSSSSSRSRMRPSDEAWPEPFIEALALQVAVDASRTLGRLSAAQAIFNVFQKFMATNEIKYERDPVCSTWRAISRSDLLWQNLTRRIWNVESLVRNTWQDEYIYRHRTASNFVSSRSSYTTIYVVPTDNNNQNDGLSCRRLALSDHHIAAGFSNGVVHLYRLSTGLHLSTFYPQHRDRLGRFSSAVSGIVLSDARLVFATLDGDIHMAAIVGGTPLRRAHLGDVVNDGALVDFSGCDRWWVGLYAGVPGHAFRIWNSSTEELVFVGGTLTDPEAVMGWHLLTELTDLIGRVRVTSHDTAVACTSLRVVAFDLRNQGVVLGEEEFGRGIIVGSFDAVNDLTLITDARGSGTIRRMANLEEVCRFTVRGGRLGEMMGCVNGGYGMICVGGVIRVWEIENGEYLYRFRETIGDISAIIADERYVAAYSTDGTIHIWDFGA
ncbi:hypothetical protein CASFOL_026827 [Castilleja foliolosa]|uniref:Transcriptional regulator STERILE APETALA-like n=1 Tax=Castilleja foliolosa TaxID=1961234 RepID=A0ABD3CLH0_9LAMI